MPTGGVMFARATPISPLKLGCPTIFITSLLPISNAAIAVEAALQHFLFKRMFLDLFFVDLNAQPRLVAGADDAPFLLDREAFADDVLAPRHIEMHRFADDVGRCRES